MVSDPTSHNLPSEMEMDVICPSLPGYGFSDKPRHKGYGVQRMAQTMAKLMDVIGYKSYFVQGGDWGSWIGSQVAIYAPTHVKGLHLNLNIFGPGKLGSITSIIEILKLRLAPTWFFDQDELAGLERCMNYVKGSFWFMLSSALY